MTRKRRPKRLCSARGFAVVMLLEGKPVRVVTGQGRSVNSACPKIKPKSHDSHQALLEKKVRAEHPEFDDDDVEAFMAFLSLKKRRSELYKWLADS
jgi:hypothetical protein